MSAYQEHEEGTVAGAYEGKTPMDAHAHAHDETQRAGLTTSDGRSVTTVAVIGWGVSGRAAAHALQRRGIHVRAYDSRAQAADASSQTPLENGSAENAGAPHVEVHVQEDSRLLAERVCADAPDLVVVSPGIPAHAPIFDHVARAGIDLVGEVELAWRLQELGEHAGRPWLCVTGTNGKTTTVGLLGSMLRASGARTAEVGNIGQPICETIDGDAEVFAVELSSFQLHTMTTVSPLASVCLNVDSDHVDWHGSTEAYAADKARIYHATQKACIYPAHDRRVEKMVEDADVVEGARAIGITLGIPSVSQYGLVEDALVERAFVDKRHAQARFLAELDDLRVPFGPHLTPAVVLDVLAAAALAGTYGVDAQAIAEGIRTYRPAGHRRAVIAEAADMTWIDDSKATNAHAAAASLAGAPAGSVVWIAGGDPKGQTFDDLVQRVAPQLRGVVLIGEDRAPLREALAAHAPRVPVQEVAAHEDWMFSVVNEAVALSRPGDTVILAPACASWDQFENYGQRGDVFREAVERLAAQWGQQ